MSTTNNITISGHHIDITPALEKEINHIVEQLQHKCDSLTNVHVTLKIDTSTTTHKQRQKAEAKCHLFGKDIFAEVSSDDMYDALKKLKSKLERQIIKHKETIKCHVEHNHQHEHHHNNAFKSDEQSKKL